jgi:hypothetical protein
MSDSTNADFRSLLMSGTVVGAVQWTATNWRRTCYSTSGPLTSPVEEPREGFQLCGHSPIFKGNRLYMTNMSATDDGINSKVSVMQAAFSGLPLN